MKSEQGYWLYDSGFAYWGIALCRNGEEPIKIDKATYELPVEERIKHHAKTVAEMKQAKDAEEVKQKAREAAKAPKKA